MKFLLILTESAQLIGLQLLAMLILAALFAVPIITIIHLNTNNHE